MFGPPERAKVAECYRRAAECKELAERSNGSEDRRLYLEREAGWLALARRLQLSDSVGTFLQELERKGVVLGHESEQSR